MQLQLYISHAADKRLGLKLMTHATASRATKKY